MKATGKKQLIIAGTITSVCMAFPCIAAVHDGYQVFAVMDASGTYSKMAQEITLARVVQAGVVPMDTAAVCSEIQRTWNRDDAAQWAEAYAALFPPYQLLIESFLKAQEVVGPALLSLQGDHHRWIASEISVVLVHAPFEEVPVGRCLYKILTKHAYYLSVDQNATIPLS